MRLIEPETLIDNIDWDNDFQKWALRGEPEDIPTVDAVEVVHGYWEVVEPKKFPNETARIRCSSCKKEPKKHTHHEQGHGYSFDVDSWDATDYCPNCGAKMDGEEKDSNLLFADMEEIIDA